jgi:small subunit ribosomal protein S1
MEDKNMEELMKEFDENTIKLEEGMIVEGTIYSIGNDDVIVSLGHMYDGVVDRLEIEEEKLNVDEKINFEILKIDDENGQIVLSRKGALEIETVEKLDISFENKESIEVMVKEVIKGGLRVDFKGIRGFMPFSQIDIKYVENADEYIDTKLDCLINDWNLHDKNLVVSRRALLEIDKDKKEKEFFETLEIDQIIDGNVYKIFKSGALIDLGATMGYLYINDASWIRIKNMEEIINVGDKIKVQIKSFNKEERKISLSLRDITVNPWDTILDDYEVGDVVYGKIFKDISSGLLVQLETGVIGYIHKSELGNKKYQLDDEITVEIERIDIENEKISLLFFDEDSVVESYENEEKEKTTIGDIFGDIFDKI